MPTTTFDSKALILGQVWLTLKDDSEWRDFIWYNDIGLPLAFAFSEKIINHTTDLEQYINETWDLLLEAMQLEDIGFDDIQDMFDAQDAQDE
jgi:hypothetical protein